VSYIEGVRASLCSVVSFALLDGLALFRTDSQDFLKLELARHSAFDIRHNL